MTFQIDPELLGPAVTDSTLRITFRAPAFFQLGNPDRVQQIREMVLQEQKPDDPMAIEPALIYGRPDHPGTVCTVSRFLRPPAGGMNPEWIELCRKSTQESVAPATAQDDLFRIGQGVALQFLVQNPQMVLFRLVVQGPGPEPVRIDYLIPRPDYESVVRAIESSMGSMVLF